MTDTNPAHITSSQTFSFPLLVPATEKGKRGKHKA